MTETTLPADVIRFREITALGLTAFTGLLCASSIVLEWIMGRNVLLSVSLGVVLVTLCTTAIKGAPTQTAARMTIGAVLSVALMMLIYATRGYGEGAIQEAHMFYFVTNTFLVPLMCVRTQILYNVVVVAHHVMLTFLAPALVWDNTDLIRGIGNLGVHAGIAVILVGPLLALAWRMLQSSIQNRGLLNEAQDLLRTANENRTQLAAAEQERRRISEIRQQEMRAEAVERDRQLQFAGELQNQLSAQLEHILTSVTQASENIQTGAEGLTDSSQNMRQANLDMLHAGEEVATNLAGIAASANELSASVSETSKQAAQAASTSSLAAKLTSDAAATVEQLTRSGQEVGSVTDLIGEIAFRTMILSLNAAVEAARAGEAGRGFAVVATEIRHLANQATDATKDVTVRIANIVDNTRQVVSIIETVRSAANEANAWSTTIAQATDAQRAATDEIARNVAAAAALSERSSQQSEHGVSVTQQMAARCEEMLRLTERLTFDVKGAEGEARRLVNTLAA